MRLKYEDSPMNILRFSLCTWHGLGKRDTGVPTTEYIADLLRQDANASALLDSDVQVPCVKPARANR